MTTTPMPVAEVAVNVRSAVSMLRPRKSAWEGNVSTHDYLLCDTTMVIDARLCPPCRLSKLAIRLAHEDRSYPPSAVEHAFGTALSDVSCASASWARECRYLRGISILSGCTYTMVSFRDEPPTWFDAYRVRLITYLTEARSLKLPPSHNCAAVFYKGEKPAAVLMPFEDILFDGGVQPLRLEAGKLVPA